MSGIGDVFDSSGFGAAKPGSLTSLFDPGDLLGTHAAGNARDAQERATQAQLEAVERARQDTLAAEIKGQGFLAPFGGVGQQGVDQASFLTDPNQQFQFLENNPLFQLSLDNANRQTQQSAASRGRLSAGDTLEQLSNNALLSASPLIQQQKGSISDLLNVGTGVARAQANTALGVGSDLNTLSQSQGNVAAAGLLGQNQIAADQAGQRTQLATTALSFFSDPALKTNKKITGEQNGHTLWSWDWNELAGRALGLFGSSHGVMADEVLSKKPEAVTYSQGYMMINYDMIGVKHGY